MEKALNLLLKAGINAWIEGGRLYARGVYRDEGPGASVHSEGLL